MDRTSTNNMDLQFEARTSWFENVDDDSYDNPEDKTQEIKLKFTMKEKLDLTQPYNLFMVTIPSIESTIWEHDSITFRELLCPSLGKLKKALYLTYHVGFDWLINQYCLAGVGETPITILHGDKNVSADDNKFPSVTTKFIDLRDNGGGLHHVKLFIHLFEDDSVMVMVGTPNIEAPYWNNHAHQIWVSPVCSKNERGDYGDSPTGFKSSLLKYLSGYKESLLGEWIGMLKDIDFSQLQVFFIGGIPGRFGFPSMRPSANFLESIGTILSREFSAPCGRDEIDDWPIIIQTYGMGLVLRHSRERWMEWIFLKNFGSHRNNPFPKNYKGKFSIIYMTKDDAEKVPKLPKCPYPTHSDFFKSMQWLRDQNYLCKWFADKRSRTGIFPMTRSVCRISPDYKRIGWYLLTTSNLSGAAYGGLPKKGVLEIKNYEAAILFLPKYFNKKYFTRDNIQIVYDLPLTPYDLHDEPRLRPDFEDREK